MSTTAIGGFLPKDLCGIVIDYAEDIKCDVCKYTYEWGFQCKFLASGAHTLTHTHCSGCFQVDGKHTWDCTAHPDKCPGCPRHDGKHTWDCTAHPDKCPGCPRHDGVHTWDCTAHQRH